jgi:hypothetical protein
MANFIEVGFFRPYFLDGGVVAQDISLDRRAIMA